MLGQVEAAKKDYEKHLRNQPSTLEEQWVYAGVLGTLGSEKEAIARLQALIRDHPKFAHAYDSLAAGLLLRKDLEAAIEHASKAIALDETLSHAYQIRAYAYFFKGDFTRFLEDSKRLLELTPLPPPAPEQVYLLRGLVLNRLGKPHLALDTLQMAQRLKPGTYLAAKELWYAYSGLGNWHLASHLAEELVHNDPKEVFGWYACASSYMKVSRPEDALKAAEKALVLAPEKAESHWRIAQIYAGIGEYESALKHFDKALAIEPKGGQAMRAKAVFLASCPDPKFRDGQEAKRLALKVIEMGNSEHGECLMALALAHAECGEFTEAVQLATKALGLVPDSNKKRLFESLLKDFQQNKPGRDVVGGRSSKQ
jgi:tetratricopeptide (TPR) repeat protein